MIRFKFLRQGTPILKVAIYARYFLYRYLYRWQLLSSEIFINATCQEVDDQGISFFGYYNLSPTNIEGDILFLKVTKEQKRLSKLEPASIILKQKNLKIEEIALTRAWNWQQGCMLQWLPNRKNSIIFNDYSDVKGNYISRVIKVNDVVSEEYPIAISAVSRCGKFALGLNYSRLAKLRPDYGYFNDSQDNLSPDNMDGIWRLDLENRNTRLIITLETLKNLQYSPTMYGAIHKVNHIDINPSGERFIFLHRWKSQKGRFMRLISSNAEGKDLFILNGDKMTSHCCWLNDSEILSFCEYNGEKGYHKFKDKTDEVSLLSCKLPGIDGHPSVSPNGQYLITDTYPDKARMSYLFLYSLAECRLTKLGRFHQPLRYSGEIRIDLHPKWANDGKSIFFESGHSGIRKLFQLDVSGLTNLFDN